jgi:hypothetical protein
LSFSKGHIARQFPHFFRHPPGPGLQSGDLLLQFLALRGGEGTVGMCMSLRQSTAKRI